MGKKVYAIKEGFDKDNNKKVENMIAQTWGECLKYVKGVKGAKYKSFGTIEEAQSFLNEKSRLLKKGVDSYPLNVLHAYVDGSFNEARGRYSYGLAVLKDDVILFLENGEAEDDSQKQLRQIAGELKAAVRAIEYAVSHEEKELVIFHDYEGISHHATGFWERKDESSKEYYERVNELISQSNLKLTFVKVDSHTGDINNEIADELAKTAAGLNLNGAVNKWLNSKHIQVMDDDIKQRLSDLCSKENEKNIVIAEEKNLKNKNINNLAINEINNMKNMPQDKLLQYISRLDDNLKNDIIIRLINAAH